MKISFEASLGIMIIPFSLVLIVLKLVGVISWNWWLVCSPLLFVTAMFVVVLLAVLMFWAVCKVIG